MSVGRCIGFYTAVIPRTWWKKQVLNNTPTVFDLYPAIILYEKY